MPSAGLETPSVAAASQRTRGHLMADGTKYLPCRPRRMLVEVRYVLVNSYGLYAP
jgi:hypothetical protein